MRTRLPAGSPALLPPVIPFFFQMWRGRCPVTGRRALGSNVLEMCRWDRSEGGPGCVPGNLVLLAVDVANRVDQEGTAWLDAAVRTKIEATLEAQRVLDL